MVEYTHVGSSFTNAPLIGIEVCIDRLAVSEFPGMQLACLEGLLVIVHEREVNLSEGGDNEFSLGHLVIVPQLQLAQ